MNYFYRSLLSALLLLAINVTQAQLKGTRTIPSTNYPTVKIAVDSINTYGVGAGGIIFNITPGHYERTTGNIAVLNNTGSSNSITFKKNGAGANPIITGGTGVGTLDGVIRVEGTDSVTFDGLEIRDTTANTTATQMMENGIAFYRKSTTDGPNNCKVINCVIKLQKTNTSGSNGVGLYVTNSSGVTQTATIITSYRASNLLIDNDSISNVQTGILLSNTGSPNSVVYDDNVTIRNNNISNFGNSTNTYYGIRFDQCTGASIYNNTIIGGSGNTTTCYGIYNTGNDSMSNTVRKNTITLTPSNTTSQITAINFASYSGAQGTLTVDSNTITNCTSSSVSTAEWDGIKLTTSLNFTTNIRANNITNNKYGSTGVTATGVFYPIFVSAGANTNTGSSLNINDNIISGNRRVQSANSTGNSYMIHLTAENLTTFIYNNTIQQDTFPGSSEFSGIFCSTTSSTYRKIYNNTISNNNRLHGIAANSSGNTSGINSTHGTGVDTIINNVVRDYSITGTGTFSAFTVSSGTAGTKYLYADSVYNIADSGTFNGITHTAGTNAALVIRKCYLGNNSNKSSTSSFTGLNATFSAVGTTNNAFIDSNTIINNSKSLGTSGNFVMIQMTIPAFNMSISNNYIANNTLGSASALASGTFYGISTTAANTTALSSVTINKNIFVGNRRIQSSLTSGVNAGINCAATSVNQTISNNYIAYNTLPSTGVLYGINNTGTSANGTWNIYNNSITRNYRSSTSTGSITGIILQSGATTINANVYNNSVDSFSTLGTGQFFGIQNSAALNILNIYGDSIRNNEINGNLNYCVYQAGAATTANIYRNRIGNIINRNASCNNFGIVLASGTTNNVYNNLIGNLHAPISTGTLSLVGIYSSAGTNNNIYYNTVRLNGTSSGNGFGTAALYSSTTPTTDVRNNIFVNTSTNSGSGQTVAFRRTGAGLTAYRDTSGNNIYYAGTAGTNNLLFTDGLNPKQTISTMQSFFRAVGQTNRDLFSYSENINFLDTNYNSSNWLKVDPSAASSVEGGGQNIYFKTTDDYSSNVIRTGYPLGGQVNGGGALPDIGAYEGDGTPKTTMTYSTTNVTTASTVSTARNARNQQILKIEVVSSGQYNPVTITNLNLNPNGTDSLTDLYLDSTRIFYTGNVSKFDSLAKVSGGIMANPNYNIPLATKLMSGSNYFWLTFDVKPTATYDDTVDAGLDSITVAGTTYNISSAPTGERIIRGPMCGNYTVGASGYDFATITDAIYSLSIRGVDTNCTSRVTLNLMDATYSSGETFPIIVQEIAGSSYGGRSVIMKPGSGVTATVTGANTNSLFILNGTDYFTIDGSNNGSTSRNLTFYNSIDDNVNTQSYDVIRMVSKGANAGCKLDTIRNSTIQNYTGVWSSAAATAYSNACISMSGSTSLAGFNSTAAYDMDSIAIYGNVLNKSHYGIYMPNALATNKSDRVYIGYNEIGSSAGSDVIQDAGIFVQNIDNSTIEHNHIFNLRQYSWIISPFGMDISTGVTNTNIRKNKFHGYGYNLPNGNVFGSGGIRINTGTSPAKDTIANNIMYDISGCGSTTSASAIKGLLISSGQSDIAVYNNSINLTGTIGHPVAAIDTSACIWFDAPGATNVSIRNNVLVNKLFNSSGTALAYCIKGVIPSLLNNSSDDNDYYISGSQAYVGFISPSNRSTLANWQSAVGSVIDSGSISSNPNFNADTSLTPLPGSPLASAADSVTGVTDDYNGTARSVTTPSIGAFETARDVIPPTISYTVITNTSNTGNYTLNNLATVTDAFSNPVKNVRLYYKKSTDNNTYVGNTSADNGWKYVDGTGTSPFSFVIDSSIIFGGSFTAGDQIQYFVVAEDSVSTPAANVGINSGTFAATPSASLLTSAAFPITGTINSYYVSNPISGTIVVDSAGGVGVYTTLTASDGAFNYINSSLLGGDVTIEVHSHTLEPGTIALNNPSCVGGPFKLYITPNNTTTRVISGSVANAMIRLNGAQNVIFDGRDPGSLTGQYLTFRNTNTSNATFAFTNDCKMDTIKYCIVEGSNVNNTPSPSGTSSANATIYIGTGPSSGNDSINVSNCKIGNISSSAVPTVAIYSEGASSLISNDGISIQSNEIYNFRDYGIYGFGATNGPNWNMSGNSFYNNLATPPSTSQFPIRFEPGSIADRTTINNNYVGGSAANCSGTWVNSGLNTCNAIRVSLGTGDTSNIQGNVIKNWSFTNTTSGLQFVPLNIQSNGIIKVGTSSPNMIGDTANATSILLANSTNHFGILCLSSNYVDIQNNYISGITQSNTTASTLNLIDARNGTILVHNNTIGHSSNTGLISSAGTNTIQGIALSGNGSSSISIFNNTIGGISNTSTTGGAFNGISASGTLFNPTIYNNIIGHADGTTGNILAGPATFTGILSSATGTTNIYDNTVSGINLTNSGAATFSGISYSGAGLDGAIYNNTIGHSSASNAINMSGTGTFTGVSSSNSSVRAAKVYNNLIANVTRSNTGSHTNYGIFNSTTSDTSGVQIYGNTVRNFSLNGTATGIGIYAAGGTVASLSNKVYNNVVRSIAFTHSTAAITFYGIQGASTGDFVAYSNTIGDSTTTNSITANEVTSCFGIYNSTATDTVLLYNNGVAGITLSNNTSSPSVFGIYNTTAPTQFLDSNNMVGNPAVTGSITIAGLGTFAGHNYANTATVNGISIRNNTIGGLNRTGTGSYTSYGILNSNSGNTGGLNNINNNTIQNLIFAGAATTYGINSTTSTASLPGYGNRVYNNTIKTAQFTHASSSSLFYPLYGAGADWMVYNNIIGDTSATSDISMKEVGTNGFGAIYNNSGTDTVIVYGNIVGGITINNSSTSPSMYGFTYVNTTTYPSYLVDSANMIGNANVNGSITIAGGGTFYGHNFPTNIAVTGARGINIRNNSIGGITRSYTGSANTYGIYDAWAPTGLQSAHNINNNTIDNWSLANAGITTGIFLNLSSSRNNFVYNNTIKRFSLTNTGSSSSFAGIAINAGKVLVTQPDSSSDANNIIGDPNVSNSISSALNGPHNGISSASANAIIVKGNSVNNITATSTGTSCTVVGIACGNGATATTIVNNTVKNLSGAGTTTNSFSLAGAVCGIYTTSTSTMTVTNNIVNGIALTSTGTSSNAMGIDLYNSGNLNINSNRIYNMSSTSNGNLTGLYYNSTNASTHVIKNNQISITNGANTNDLPIQGIFADNAASSGTFQMYYNTVYLNGSVSTGSNVSAAYYRNSTTGTTNVLNNIFWNQRTGGGTHVTQNYNSGITNNRTNYNLNVTSDSNVAVRSSSNTYDINGWRSGLKRDSSGWYAMAGYNIDPDSMFIDKTNGDLGINTNTTDAWYANGKGLQTPGYSDEYGNPSSVRSTTIAGGAPDLGSDEFTPSSEPDALFVKGPHTVGNTDSLMYGFRPVAWVRWTTAGTMPSWSTLRYYTDVVPPDNTNNGNNPTAKYMKCYWIISATGGANYEYDMYLKYDDALLGSLSSESAAKVSRKQINVSGTWKGHLADAAVNTGTNIMSLLHTTGFSIWTGSDQSDPLPVTLLTFTGAKQGKNVLLNWTTAFEDQMDGYTVEHSADGTNFTSIGFVKSNNNTFSESKYSLLHENPVKGVNYYRLKSIELNGKYTYSNIVVVNFEESERMQIVIQPNPTRDQVSIVFQNQTQPALVQVYDMAGRLMFNQKVNLGQNATQVDLSTWNQGSYILRVTNEDGTSFISRIVKVEE